MASAIRLALCCIWFITIATCAPSLKPNIVLFMADDLGYGDIGRFGNTTLRTPNIDSIGADGVTMTQHISAASVCTPSRAAFLTSRYAVRSGLASDMGLPVIPFVASSAGLPPSEITFATLLKSAGYRTALIDTTVFDPTGKWHLGHSCAHVNDHCHHPNNHGFDFFYGIPTSTMEDFGHDPEYMVLSLFPNLDRKILFSACIGALTLLVLRYLQLLGRKMTIVLLILIETPLLTTLFLMYNPKPLNSILMRNAEVVEQPMNLKTLTPRFVEESVKFIEDCDRDDVPFLLFMSWHHPHTALVPMDAFKGKSQHGLYGDCVEEMDWGIGEIMSFIQKKRMTDNTLMYFTSDNGGHVEETGYHGDRQGGYNGVYQGGKSHATTDGGVRVPGVMKWPGHVTPDTFVHRPTSLMDVYPTIVSAAGVELPKDRQIDGKDLLPLIQTGEGGHEILFHYCGSRIFAVRYAPRGTSSVYKLLYYEEHDCNPFACMCQSSMPLSPPRLRALHDDPSERGQYLNIDPGSRYGDIISIMDIAKMSTFGWRKTTVVKMFHKPPGTASVYKLLYYEEHDCNPFACMCQSSMPLSPPRLRALHDDPSERGQYLNIDPGSQYGDIISIMDAAKRAHENGIVKVKPQMTFNGLVWKPWLQPCCTLPTCTCVEDR